MRFKVNLELDIDVEIWSEEHGSTIVASIVDILGALRDEGWYYRDPKWYGLLSIASVRAEMNPFDAANGGPPGGLEAVIEKALPTD